MEIKKNWLRSFKGVFNLGSDVEIFKFFYPHFNPLLRSIPPRQQELSELEQVASLLRKALEKMQQRALLKSNTPLPSDLFSSAVKAARFVENAVSGLVTTHPGDTDGALYDLVQERSTLPGWKSWSSLLREQLIDREREKELGEYLNKGRKLS